MDTWESRLEERKLKIAIGVAVSIVIVGVALIGLVLCVYVDQFGVARANSQEIWGQFGDFVGGLTNPALSFLSLLVLLLALYVQVRESRKTSKALVAQLEALKKDRFEATFFKILERMEESSERLSNDVPIPDGSHKSFAFWVSEKIRKIESPDKSLSYLQKARYFRNALIDIFQEGLIDDVVLQWFRRVKKVQEYINHSTLSDLDKELYRSIFVDSFGAKEHLMYYTLAYVYTPHVKRMTRRDNIGWRVTRTNSWAVHFNNYFSVTS